MSDFDREAERERLREQFEADKRKREQSERMSELLLKGATMTNKHCDRCGDPVFRWDGQEFCPTCQGGPGGEPADAADATADADATESQPTSAGEEAPTPDADPAAVPDEDATPTPQRANEDPGATADTGRHPDGRDTTAPSNPTPEPSPRPATAATESPDSASTGREDVAAARASLARTLASLSARAESADDLSSTREYLAAAREAAEALDAAERAGR